MIPLTLALVKLLGLTLLGYILFSIPGAQGKPKRVFTHIIMNGLIPLYYLYNIPLSWGQSTEASPLWSGGVFFGSMLFLMVNTIFGRWLVKKLNIQDPNKWTFPFLVGIHNAGYIPIPLLLSLNPPATIMTYMFIWNTAFNLYFWSYVISKFEKPKGFPLKLNGPLIGLLGGFIIAFTGIYTKYPEILNTTLEVVAPRGFDGVLILLGAILAGVNREKLHFHKEFYGLIGIRYLLYPLIAGVLLAVIPLGSGWDPHFTYTFKMGILIQTFAPPATNLMIITGITGQKEETVNYTASGIVYTYLASFIIMPILLYLFGGIFTLS